MTDTRTIKKPGPPPTTLNGLPVLAAFATNGDHATRPGFVVLVEREHDAGDAEFITAWAGDGDNSWCWGHYYADKAKAEAYFASRCARGY